MTLSDNVFENLRLELRRGCLTLAVLAQLRQEHYGYTLRKALAEHGMVIEDLERNRIFAGDDLIEHRARGRIDIDDLLLGERAQIGHAGVLALLNQHRADERHRAGGCRRAP